MAVNSLSFLAVGISDKKYQPRTKSMTKEGGQVGSNGMDVFEAGEGATMQRIPMLRDDAGKGGGRRNEPKNVLGDRLDIGSHTVCAVYVAGPLLSVCDRRGVLHVRTK
jgi:hypothetical protein